MSGATLRKSTHRRDGERGTTTVLYDHGKVSTGTAGKQGREGSNGRRDRGICLEMEGGTDSDRRRHGGMERERGSVEGDEGTGDADVMWRGGEVGRTERG